MNNDVKKNNLNAKTKLTTANNKKATTTTTASAAEEATKNQQQLQRQQKTATTAKHTQKSAAAARSNKQAAKAQKQNSNLGNNNNNSNNQSAALNLSAAATAASVVTTATDVDATAKSIANTELRASTPTTPNSDSSNNNDASGNSKRAAVDSAEVVSTATPLTESSEPTAVITEQPASVNMAADPTPPPPGNNNSSVRKARIRVKNMGNLAPFVSGASYGTPNNSNSSVTTTAADVLAAIVSTNNTKNNNNTPATTTPASTAATAATAPPVNSNKMPKNAKQTTASTAPAKCVENAKKTSSSSSLPSTATQLDQSPTCSSASTDNRVRQSPPPSQQTPGSVSSTDVLQSIAATKAPASFQTTTTATNTPAPTTKSSTKESQLKLSALPLLMGSAAAAAAAAAASAGGTSSGSSNNALIPPLQNKTASAAALRQKILNVAAASAAGALASTRSSNSSTSSSLTSSVGIAISNAFQTIITSDTSDTDTEVFPPRITDLSESDEESVSEILLACLCLRPDLLDDIPESDPDEVDKANDDEDDSDDEDEDEDIDDEEEDDDEDEEHEEEDDDEDDDEEEIDEDEDEDEEIQDPNEATGDFLLDANIDRNRNLNALFEAAANEKAPVLRHATHAIDETKQALTKMRCANSPRDKTILSRTLIAACNDNDVNTVRRLLGKGNVNINEPTDDGESLLSMACSAGYYELAQVLLAMSAAQVEDKGQKDCTPLMEAASAGHLEIVKLLLSHNADVNAHCATGNTPLMFACAGGHVEVVRELLKAGANVEEQNENGHTPLMEAASAGHVEVAKVLLEHGAGINTHSNEFKESALTLACYKGHLNMVRFLLQAGADQEHKTDEMHTALMEASMDGHVEVARLLLDSGAQVNMPTDSFESPLTLAACGGHVELATLLIERGANIEEVNDEGYTPLMEAAREGHEEMVALLLSKGANINATTEETQETALTLACCGGFSEVAEFLIKEGANLELGASTPLMEAAQEGHTDLVRFLLENKANVHAETQTGDTALTHACENGHTDAAEVLLSYGAELEHESEGARTPLMKACRAGHLCTVTFLILKGADVNRQTSNNDHTPLSLACAGGHQAVVEYLLKSGADPFHKLKDNSTMLIEAAKGGHTRVVELLFKCPHFIQNHQNELQAAAAAATKAASTVCRIDSQIITDAAAAYAAGSRCARLFNMQHQKQLQQQEKQLQQTLQQQLQNLSAPPGLHEVSDAVRANNQQQMQFHQQQFTAGGGAAGGTCVATPTAGGQQQQQQHHPQLQQNQQQLNAISGGGCGGVGEYLDEQLQLAAAAANAAAANGAEEYASAIDINSLSAQQQEALIAKSRLFHLQAGFEMGLPPHQQQQILQQQLPDSDTAAAMDANNLQPIMLDMVQVNSLTPPPAKPTSMSSLSSSTTLQEEPAAKTPMPLSGPPQQHQPKLKGSQRGKNRQQQPPAPFELNLAATAVAPANVIPSHQIEYEIRKRAVSDDGVSTAITTANELNDDNNQSAGGGGDVLEEFPKNLESYRNLVLSNQAIGQVSGTEDEQQQQQQNLQLGQLQANNVANNAIHNKANDVTRLANRSNKNLQQQQHKGPCAISVGSGGSAADRNNTTTQIITPSDVSQSTAISDRPKAKAVSKKDGKNFRKTTFTQLPMLQQHQMVSIYNNNMPMLLSNSDNKQQLAVDQNNQAMFNPMMYMQQHQQQLQLTTAALDVGGNATGSVGGGIAGLIDYSNSPASPLASPPNANSPNSTIFPSPDYIIQQQQQQHAYYLEQLAVSNSQQQQQKQKVADGTDDTTNCCPGQAMALVENNRSLTTADGAAALSAVDEQHCMGSHPAATAFGMYKIAERNELLKKVDMKIPPDGWQFFGINRYIDEQLPKSPTDTPPEKQMLSTHYTAALEQAESSAGGVAGAQISPGAKNLSTLCSVAAAAAVEVENAAAAAATDAPSSGSSASSSNENRNSTLKKDETAGNGEGEIDLLPNEKSLAQNTDDFEFRNDTADNENNASAAKSSDENVENDAEKKTLEETSRKVKAEAEDSSDSEERDFDIFDYKSDDSEQQRQQQQEQPHNKSGEDVDLQSIREQEQQFEVDTCCAGEAATPMSANTAAEINDQRKLSNRFDNINSTIGATAASVLSEGPLRMVDIAQMVNDFNRDMNTLEDMKYLYPQLSRYLNQTTLNNASIDGSVDSPQDDKESEQVMAFTEQFYLNQQNLEETFGAAVSDNGSASSGETSTRGNTGRELYPVLDEPIEQFEEVEREPPMYDLAVDHLDEIFQVIHNVNEPSMQDLNCTELSDYGLNTVCKARWNGNCPQAPKWSSQEQLLAAHQQALLSGDDHQLQQQQQQQQQSDQQQQETPEQVTLRDRLVEYQKHMEASEGHRKQRAALSLLPYVSEGSEAAIALQILQQEQQYSFSANLQYQQQQLNALSAAGGVVTDGLKQHIQQLPLQNQQKNARLLKEMAATPSIAAQMEQQQQAQNNFVFNVDGSQTASKDVGGGGNVDPALSNTVGGNIDVDKASPQLQLMFEMPQNVGVGVGGDIQQQQAPPQDQDEAQQLQSLQLVNQKLLDHQECMILLHQQEQQIFHDLPQDTAKRILQQRQSQQLEQMALYQQNKAAAALSHQVFNQQVLKQQQLLIHQQQQQQKQQVCAQHAQQVQVATQTPSTVVVPHGNVVSRGTTMPQFCQQMPLPNDISNGLGGVCAVTNAQHQQQQQLQYQQQQQQHQHQLQQHQHQLQHLQQHSQQMPNVNVAQQLPAPPLTTPIPTTTAAATTTTTTKTPSGIAKKAIDKQARKDRNRYSLIRQSPAGGQVNAAAQQHYQQAVAAAAAAAATTTTVDKTIDVDSETDSNHDTALTLACAGGHEELVELLITRGANIEHRDKKGFTPLILAATAGHEKVVDILLKRNAQLEAQSERTKDTPLSLACSGGRYEVVELLLKIGANKEHRNVSDYTPLSLAASGGYVNIIKLLLTHGAEINSRTGSKLGISPLMLAAMNGHTAAVKLLLDQGSDINAQIETNRNTALTLACFQGRHEVVSLLLDRKANVEHRAKTGLTPLMEAASGGYIEVGRVLLDKGADVNAAPVPTSRDTALTIAADKGHLKFVELLLSRNAIVEVKNKKGNSPLWLAAHGGHLSVVEILYAHDADIDSQDNRRVSCLMAAFRKGHTKVVKWMVQYVTQFPSDQEMTRFVSTISDKELSEKCYECMKIIHAAKVAQEVKAFQNARSLLDELDMERSREESRRAAAARRRERKKKKKLEKKEEKRRQMQGGANAADDDAACDDDDKDSDKDDMMDSDRDDEDNAVDNADDNGQRDSGIDRSSCSSAEVKAVVQQQAAQQALEKSGGKNKNKKKNKNAAQQQQQTVSKSRSPEHDETSANSKSNKPTKKQTAAAVEQQPATKSAAGNSNNKKQQLNAGGVGIETKLQQSATTTQKKLTSSAATDASLNNHNSKQRAADDQQSSTTTTLTTAGRKKDNSSSKQREKENHAPKANEQTLTSSAASMASSNKHPQQQQQQQLVDKAKADKLQESNNNGGNRKLNDSKAELNALVSHHQQQRDHPHQRDQHHHQRDQHHGLKSTPPKRGEDGWKEVVRKSSTQQSSSAGAPLNGPGASMPTVTSAPNAPSSASHVSFGGNNGSTSSGTSGGNTVPPPPPPHSATSEMTVTKKVQVPVNAISRVIGRGGSNINAIRAATGAHIEVEKQGKNQSERSITIKGQSDATKQAHMLILALIKDPDVDILQMLPRMNAASSASSSSSSTSSSSSSAATASLNAKANVANSMLPPMTVGTWDNKTATQASAASSSSNTSSASSAASTPAVANNYTSSAAQGSMSYKSSSYVASSHSNVTNTNSNSKYTSNQKSLSGSSRSQASKLYAAQQQPHQMSRVSGSNGTQQQKQSHKLMHVSNGGSSGGSSSYVGALTNSQKKPSSVNSGQTSFAAKVTGGGGSTANHHHGHGHHGHGSPTKKSDGGRLGGNVAMPYGRGKPINTPGSAIFSSTQLNNSNNNNNNNLNTLSSPIGTFNVAEVAAINEAAAAAQAANAATNASMPRSVTPIGPPIKRNLLSPNTTATPTITPKPLQQQPAQTVLPVNLQQQQALLNQQKQQQQQQHQLSPIYGGDEVTMTSAADLEAAALKSAAASAGFSTTQLPSSKISSGYSLFEDSYQTQWCGENSQIYKPASCDLVSDLPPKADASKAPGYNRNILSSPVGSVGIGVSSVLISGGGSSSSKASSNQSTSPPAPIGSQVSTSQANIGGLSVLTANTTIGVPTARSPGQLDTAKSSGSVVIVNTNSSNTNSQPNASGSGVGVIKPPAPIGQPPTSSSSSSSMQTSSASTVGVNVNAAPPLANSGLAIQRPPSSQLRTSNSGGPLTAVNAVGADRHTPINYGPIGINAAGGGVGAGGRSNGPGTIGEASASMNRYYDASVPHQFHMEHAGAPFNSNAAAVNSNVVAGGAVHPLASRLNPRASAFSQSGGGSSGNANKQPLPPPQQQQPNAIGSGIYGPGGGGNSGSSAYKAAYGSAGTGLAPSRPQSQPQQGSNPGIVGSNMQTVPPNQHRWYGGSEYGGGFIQPSVRDVLALESGFVVNANNGNSPAAMSPNQAGGMDDSRKMPRPIGTERATWKFGSYPNAANMNSAAGNFGIDDALAAAMSTAGAMANMAGGGMQQLQPWMLEKTNAAAAAAAAAAAQQTQQPPNWIKQQQQQAAAAASSSYRFYNNAVNAAGGLSTGGINMADYHHPQDAQFLQLTMDYHANMPPPSLNQSQPLNLVPNYPYPPFVGPGNDGMAPGMHMPDKMELWGGEHHDKHTWPSSNWTN